MALQSTQPLSEMSTRNLPGGGGKERLARKVDNFTAISEPIVYIMWDPQRLTNLWTSMACYRNSFTFTFTMSPSVLDLSVGGSVVFTVWSVGVATSRLGGCCYDEACPWRSQSACSGVTTGNLMPCVSVVSLLSCTLCSCWDGAPRSFSTALCSLQALPLANATPAPETFRGLL
jgi:hypothetical protein